MLYLRADRSFGLPIGDADETKPSPIQQLPGELLLRVFALVAYTPGELDDDVPDPVDILSGPPTFSRERDALIQRSMQNKRLLLRVCKSWTAHAIQFCFAALYITDWNDIPAAVAFMKRSKHHDQAFGRGAGRWVKRIDLRVEHRENENGEVLARLMSFTPNLSIFAFHVYAHRHRAASAQVDLPAPVLTALTKSCHQSLRVISRNRAAANLWDISTINLALLMTTCKNLRIVHCDIGELAAYSEWLSHDPLDESWSRLLSVQCPTSFRTIEPKSRLFEHLERVILCGLGGADGSRTGDIESFLRLFGQRLRVIVYYLPDRAAVAANIAEACPNLEWITMHVRSYRNTHPVISGLSPKKLKGIEIYTSSFFGIDALLRMLEQILSLDSPSLRVIRFASTDALPSLSLGLQLEGDPNAAEVYRRWVAAITSLAERGIHIEDSDGFRCVFDGLPDQNMNP